MTTLDRRAFLSSVGVAGAAAALPGLGLSTAAQAANERIVFATWGGSWEKAWRTAWATPFTAETKIPVISAGGNTLGKIQAMVDAGRTEWDVVEGVPELATVGAEKGLLEKLDFTVIDRSGLADRPEFKSDYSVPQVVFGRSMAYDKALPAVPADWSALWDIKRFPGKRALYNRIESGILEIALLADGVPADKIYPIDVPRAFKKLEEIRSQIIWYESLPQGEQLMRDRQASLGYLADGRIFSSMSSGANIGLVPGATILTWSVFVIPKGAPNKDAAMRFLAFVLQQRQQAAIVMEYNYGPVVPKAWDGIAPERKSQVSGGLTPPDKAFFQSSTWWSANLEKMNEKFQEWKLG